MYNMEDMDRYFKSGYKEGLADCLKLMEASIPVRVENCDIGTVEQFIRDFKEFHMKNKYD